MTTITLKINERTQAGKTLKALFELFSKENKGVQIISHKNNYSSDFVAKIRRAEKQESIKINPDNIWESLELK